MKNTLSLLIILTDDNTRVFTHTEIHVIHTHHNTDIQLSF